MHREGVARAGVVVAIVVIVEIVEAAELAEDAEVVQVDKTQVECSAICTLLFV